MLMRSGGRVLVAVAVAGVVGVGAWARPVEAQRAPFGERPHLIVVASAEVEVVPDRAHLVIAVESRGRTSQAAASENARVQTAVLEAIRRAGIPAAQIRTQSVMVSPEYEYPKEGGRPTVTGYQARNAVQVEALDLARVGGVIDAALAAGATNISGPSFALANPDSSRREALDAAVRKAMSDARVMARAAGMTLGAVLELTSEDGGQTPMFDRVGMVAMRAAEAAPTPVSAGLIPVRSTVRLKIALRPE
jgi:uncharacterized protein YggE